MQLMLKLTNITVLPIMAPLTQELVLQEPTNRLLIQELPIMPQELLIQSLAQLLVQWVALLVPWEE